MRQLPGRVHYWRSWTLGGLARSKASWNWNGLTGAFPRFQMALNKKTGGRCLVLVVAATLGLKCYAHYYISRGGVVSLGVKHRHMHTAYFKHTYIL